MSKWSKHGALPFRKDKGSQKVVLYSTVTSQEKEVGRKQRCPPKVEFGPDR
jgi:hypothetical protein